MNKQKLLPVLRHIVSRPTAPFHEQAVAEAILGFLKELPHVKVEADRHGNLVARYARGGKMRVAARGWRSPRTWITPGWVRVEGEALGPVASLPGEKRPMQFLGGVPEAYLKNPRVRSYGSFAMWNLPEFRLKNGLIHARACDDLIGCAVIVAMFMELEERNVEGRLHGAVYPRGGSGIRRGDETGAIPGCCPKM